MYGDLMILCPFRLLTFVKKKKDSNENIIEDPMNLVETSWEVSSLNEEPPPTASCSNNKIMFPQTAGVIKN